MKQPTPVFYPPMPATPHYVPQALTLASAAPKSRAADEAASSLGLTVIRWTVGGAAIVLGAVAAAWLMSFMLALARTTGEGIRLTLIAFAVALALGGLPVAGAVLSRNYPRETLIASRCWLGILIASALGVVVITLSTPSPASRQAAETRPEFLPQVIWEYSRGCREPENTYQAAMCAEFRSGPRTAAATPPQSSALWRVVVALIGVGSIGLAGMLGRLAVLSMAESRRLIGAEAQPLELPEPIGTLVQQADDVPLTPLQIFDMWFNARVRMEPTARLSASGAFEDYKAACMINGYPALSQKKFGDMLTAKATNSGGRIAKVMSSGSNFYTGLALVGERAAMDIAADGFTAVPAQRR